MRVFWFSGVFLFILLFFYYAPKAQAASSGSVTITVRIRPPANGATAAAADHFGLVSALLVVAREVAVSILNLPMMFVPALPVKMTDISKTRISRLEFAG